MPSTENRAGTNRTALAAVGDAPIIPSANTTPAANPRPMAQRYKALRAESNQRVPIVWLGDSHQLAAHWPGAMIMLI